MRKLLLTFFILFISGNLLAQCSGGANAGNITPTGTWQSTGTTNVSGGTYYTFAATAGFIYFFSFCIADGGNSSYDTQLSILNSAGVYAGGYNDDFCGLQSYLAWNCTVTGTYRVLINKYSCQSQANMGTMVYRFSAPLSCPGGLGGGVTNVPSLPYASGAGTTCGSGNDLNSTNTISCGTTYYMDGEDCVWIFTPLITGTVTINLTSAGTYTGLTLYRGCPLNGQGGTCVDYVQSSTGNKTLTVCLQAGQTYYLILDSWPAPACNPYTNLTISAPVPAGSCSTGTGTVAVASLPYSSTGRTTCGMANDVTAINSVTCGSTSYFTGEDEVFVFTPIASGTSTISLTSLSSWVGIMLYQGCPLVTSCSGIPGTCIGFSQSFSGNQSLCANLTAGQPYYLVVDQFASPTCIPSYNISISAPTGASAGITCGNPYIVASLPFSLINETTACFGNDYSNATTGSCGTLYESGEDKVYRYIATVPECIGITLSSASDNNIGYQVYSGCPGAGGTCIASNGGASSGTLTGSAVLPAAGTYYIIIDSWTPPTSVSYNINIQSYGSGPPNDLPCNAYAVPLGVNLTGNNNCSGFSGEPAPPGCWLTPNTLNTVWYSVVGPPSGTIRIRTSPGSMRNSQIALYSGTCGPGMTMIACNDNAPPCGLTINYMSEITAAVTPGVTYYVSVDGYFNETGSFGIMAVDGAQPYPPATGQECSVPNPVCNQVIAVGDPGYQAFGNTCDFPGGGGNCLLSGERGSAWYQVVINGNGNFEFNLVPNDWPGAPSTVSTDYDFALWRIQTAGVPGPDNCSTIAAGNAPIRCNYSYLGVTGCYSATTLTSPAAYPGFGPAYDAQLPVSNGDILLLVISNFSNSTSGFTMTFSAASPINYAPSGGTVVWSGGIDNDWFKPPNWGGCALPSCSINAIIPPSSANQPVIYAAGAACKSITINPSAMLTINAGFTLTVCQDFINQGTFIASPTSTVLFNNAAINQNIDGSVTGVNAFGNVTVTKTGGAVTALQNVDMRGTFIVSNASSTFNANAKYHKVGGNFTNNGTYTPGAGGTLEIFGSAAQSYFNNGSLNNLTMQHTGPGMSLLTNATLGNAGTLTLNLGKVITTPLYEMSVLNRTPSSVTTGNVNSYVEGFLRRYLNSTGSYDFPVGETTKGWQRANINFTSATTIDNLRGNFLTYGALPPPIMGFECTVTYSLPTLDNGKWHFVASNNPTSGNYTMTLYNLSYTNGTGSAFTVMQDHGAGWGLWNGSCVICGVAAVQRVLMNGFSDFGTAQAPTPLPIELLSFTADPSGNTVVAKWATASEKDNDYFLVERSTDAVSFEPIGQVKGAGNSYITRYYSLTDKNPNVGINYYRLKQVDFNKVYTYSEVVAVRFSSGQQMLAVHPNPADNILYCDFFSSSSSEVVIEITDVTGRIIKSETIIVKEGINSFSTDIQKLPAGIYYLSLKKTAGETPAELKRVKFFKTSGNRD